MYIILGIFVFGVLIFVHELGHFLAAKKLGVQVNEFSICMGPAIFQKTVGETTYSLRAIPIGGYCAMEGEDEDSTNPRAFTSAKKWKRVIILVAGAFMNFLMGLILMIGLLAVNDAYIAPTIDTFYDGAVIAQPGGLEVGDTLYAIDGERVYQYGNVGTLLARNTTGIFDLVVIRDGQKVALEDFPMMPQTFVVDGQEVLLYGMTFTVMDNTISSVLVNGWNSCLDFARMVRMGLADLVSGMVGIEDMSGPVGIIGVISETGSTAESTSLGVYRVLYLAAFIAINLGVMNLLPLPALDGGRVLAVVVTGIIEGITKKKLNPKYEGYIHAGGMILLFGFMIFITFYDVIRQMGLV